MATRNGKPNVDDDLVGTKKNDIFHGFSGNDTFWGLGGNDKFFGDEGHDKFTWNPGNDTINGGADSDDVLYQYADHGMKIDLKAGTAVQIGGGEHDKLVSIESVQGTNYNDSLYGSDRTDAIEYFIPDYTAGGNMPHPAGGSDYIDGRGGIDMLSYWNDKAGVKIDVAKGKVIDGGGHTDTFKNIEQFEGSYSADTIKGSSKADDLWGLDGNDKISGGKGKDTIHSGIGKDILTGGSGKDFFVYTRAYELSVDPKEAKRDVITDFKTGVDKIDLSGIDVDPWTDPDEAFHLYEPNGPHTTFDGVAGRLIWFHTTNSKGAAIVLIEGDRDGDMVADIQLELRTTADLNTSDFIL